MVDKLKSLGADLEWWCGKGFEVITLGEEPLKGPSKKEVVEHFGYDYEKMYRLVLLNLYRDWSIITGKIKERDGVDINTEMDKVRVEDMMEVLSSPEIRKKMLDDMFFLKQFDPQDKVLWVCALLKAHKKEEVTPCEYFFAHFLYDRILKAELSEKINNIYGVNKKI
ncbi:MAG: hypothetical protein DRO01_04740 [Thermoproteota archaeon]|nr:MAG: hypothetical protein DRO01_04740 [Candidatus Korarchaeota archaeon]